MGLIDEEKVNGFMDKKWNEYPISPNGIKYGSECIEFAENELKKLAIEFAKYCHGIGYGNSIFIDQEVFDSFLKQRNK